MPWFPEPGAVVKSRKWSYLVGDRIGTGAFGTVYECLGPFDQPFALKMYHPANRPYESVRDDWLREASRLHTLRHPNIVYVHDYFEYAGLLYLVLERCDHSLEDMIGAPMSDRLVIELARQMLFAVQYIHDNQVVHNDLHGGNFLVHQGDPLRVKLSDLGIAHELYGTSAFRPDVVQHRIMAPEVAAGGYSTKQSDLYQLGLLFYAMHTGEYAVDPSQPYAAVVEQIRSGVPRAKAEALGTPLGGIVSVLLRRTADYRYATPAQVWEDLRRLDTWSVTQRHSPLPFERSPADAAHEAVPASRARIDTPMLPSLKTPLLPPDGGER